MTIYGIVSIQYGHWRVRGTDESDGSMDRQKSHINVARNADGTAKMYLKLFHRNMAVNTDFGVFPTEETAGDNNSDHNREQHQQH